MTNETARGYTELVTRSTIDYHDLPGGAGRFAVITLDNSRSTHNSLGPLGLREFEITLDHIDQQQVVGVGVIGNAQSFAAGADLRGVITLDERDKALALGQAGHRAFARLAALTVPTFAFLNGTAVGGALELALHCRYRAVGRRGRFGLPECSLGLIPGWGGSQLLPALIGIDAAAKIIVENPMAGNVLLTPSQLVEAGVADVQLTGDDFLADCLAWAAELVTGRTTVERRSVHRDEESWESVLGRLHAGLDRKVHGTAPAPYRALELLRLARTSAPEAGVGAEDQALADLLMSDEMRASLYAFTINQQARRPADGSWGQARPVSRVGIVGAGLMAGQLALLFAQRLGVPVVLTDVDDTRVGRGVGWVHGQVEKMVSRGRATAEQGEQLRALISGSTSKEVFADADFVIEAVFEDLAVKKAVLAEVEAVLTPTCILATNTSSLSVTQMAADLAHPERVIGFHFFNPVAVLPLIEVVRTASTSDQTLSTAWQLAQKLGKTPVLVSDAPAFVVNRVLIRLLCEVMAAIDEGTPPLLADAALNPIGLPMSPLALLDLVGPAVAYHVMESLASAYPDRFPLSPNLRRIVENGHTKVLDQSGHRSAIDPSVADLLDLGDRPSTPEQLQQRVREALAQEIGLLLADGVVATAPEVDLCLLTGAGWPAHLGGITPYLDRTGTSVAVNGQRFLPPGVADVITA